MPKILQEIDQVNRRANCIACAKDLRKIWARLTGKHCRRRGGLPLSQKTDDMREASAIVLIQELSHKGARIQAYDPKATEQARFYLQEHLDSITFATSKYDALKNADMLVLVTEWREFRSPDFDEMKKLLRTP